jgi:hypothetical protein
MLTARKGKLNYVNLRWPVLFETWDNEYKHISKKLHELTQYESRT